MLGSAVDQHQQQTASLRLAEPVGALSLATDLGMGQPMDSVLLSAVLGVRLASLFDVSDAELSEVYYVALLRFVGWSGLGPWPGGCSGRGQGSTPAPPAGRSGPLVRQAWHRG